MDHFLTDTSPPLEHKPVVEHEMRKIESNLEVATSYYQESSLYIKNNHPLVRLVDSIFYTLDIDSYLSSSVDELNEIARILHLTSFTYKGNVQSHKWMGEEAAFAVRVVDGDYSRYDDKGINDIKTMRYLHHNYTTLIPIPCDESYKEDPGELGAYTSIEINLSALATKYYLYVQAGHNLHNRKGVTDFVRKHVIPDSFESFLNIAIFNRAYRLQMGMPLDPEYSQYPPYMHHTFVTLDRFLGKTLPRLTKNIRLRSILTHIPVLGTESLTSVFFGSRTRYDNTNTRTFNYYARAIWLTKLVDMTTERSLRASLQTTKRIIYLFERSLRNKDYLNFFTSAEEIETYKDTVDELLMRIKS